MIMQAVFFRLAKAIPVEEAIQHLKDSVETMYGKKGRRVVEMNLAAIDRAASALKKVEVPDAWRTAQDPSRAQSGARVCGTHPSPHSKARRG